MTGQVARVVGLCILSAAVALFLAPLFEGVMRKIRAIIHSRQGPPIRQPYLDLLKLLGKEDLRSGRGLLYAAGPSMALGSALLLAMLVPMGGAAALGFGGDVIALLYVSTMGAVLVMLTAFGSGNPYAHVGASREMMMLLCVEPVLAIALVVGMVQAGTLSITGIVEWQIASGPSISMAVAGVAFFLALQAQAGKLPFDIPEAEQELMGGPFIEQSGPRLALFRWALWIKQLLFAVILVEVFVPWPHVGIVPLDLAISLVKVIVVLALVTVVEVVNPRLRIDQALSYFLRVALVALAALAFAVIGA